MTVRPEFTILQDSRYYYITTRLQNLDKTKTDFDRRQTYKTKYLKIVKRLKSAGHTRHGLPLFTFSEKISLQLFKNTAMLHFCNPF